MIWDASRPVRFHSVRIQLRRSPQALESFLACFAAECSRADLQGAATPRVRHLFLASGTRTIRIDRSLFLYPELDEEQRIFDANISTLFDLVSADIYTLTLVNDFRNWLDDLSISDSIGLKSFPQLCELSVFGSTDLGFAPSIRMPKLSGPSVATTHLPLPNLTRLRLECWDPIELGPWASRAPGMTHLFVSNLPHYRSDNLLEGLAKVLGAGKRHDTSTSISPKIGRAHV